MAKTLAGRWGQVGVAEDLSGRDRIEAVLANPVGLLQRCHCILAADMGP